MIGKLKGRVEEIGENHVIVDVNGVGYVVYMTTRALSALPPEGEAVTCFIETQVREDAIRLFGFALRPEQEWFRLLQNVQGVGAKVALAILGTLTASELANAITLRDIALISRAPGVGKKVAERIVTELKNKGPALAGGMAIGDSGPAGSGQEDAAAAPVADAVSALCNLGYTREQAATAVMAVLGQAGAEADSARLIRLGLKELSQ